MAKSRTWKLGLALVLAATLVVLGCSSPGSSGPSKADVNEAFGGVGEAVIAAPSARSAISYTGAPPYIYTDTIPNAQGLTGSVQVTYTSTGNPSSGPSTMTCTYAFTNWYEPSTRYTINGTLTIVDTTDAASAADPLTETTTLKGDLSLSGGSVSTLSLDVELKYTISVSNTSLDSSSTTGSITADGHRFNFNDL